MRFGKMNIEGELKTALARVSPPAGFSDRVLARVREGEEPFPGRRRTAAQGGGWSRIAAAALLVVSTGLLSSHYLMEIRRDAAGERAKQELIIAMKIASQKTNLGRNEVLGLGSGSVNEKGDR